MKSEQEDVAPKHGKDLTAADVMREHVITLRNDMSVAEAATYLVDREISGAPVRAPDGQLLGVVSLTDIVEASTQDREGVLEAARHTVEGWEYRFTRDDLNSLSIQGSAATVEDIMTPAVYTVPAETPLKEVAGTMLAGRIHRLFVTRQNALVGIVTTLDILKAVARWK